MSGNLPGVLWGTSLYMWKMCIKAISLFNVGWKNRLKGSTSTKIRYNNFTVYKLFWGEAQYFLSPSKSS